MEWSALPYARLEQFDMTQKQKQKQGAGVSIKERRGRSEHRQTHFLEIVTASPFNFGTFARRH